MLLKCAKLWWRRRRRRWQTRTKGLSALSLGKSGTFWLVPLLGNWELPLSWSCLTEYLLALVLPWMTAPCFCHLLHSGLQTSGLNYCCWPEHGTSQVHPPSSTGVGADGCVCLKIKQPQISSLENSMGNICTITLQFSWRIYIDSEPIDLICEGTQITCLRVY